MGSFITRTTHVLPFDRLSGEDFERLCFWLVEAEGYQDASHYGLGGKDSGRDIVASRKGSAGDGNWIFQAKRSGRISFSQLKEELNKVIAFRDSKKLKIAGVVFVTPAAVSASARDNLQSFAAMSNIKIEFWAATELDLRVKRYPHILAEFFNLPFAQPTPGAPKRSSLVEDKSSLLRIFLCHSKSDRTRVRELYSRLASDGFDAWFDEDSLLPGHNWEYEIGEAVRNAHAIVVCLSKAAVTRAGYVHKEIKYALDAADEQPEGAVFIIPVRFEECEVPGRLRQWQWLDYGTSDSYERLKRSLEQRKKQLHFMSPDRRHEEDKRLASVVSPKDEGSDSHRRTSPVLVRSSFGLIELESKFLRIVEHAAVQKLRAQPQLEFVYLVYPAATHDKFTHALNAFDFMKRLFKALRSRDQSSGLSDRIASFGLASAILQSLLTFPLATAFTELAGFSWSSLFKRPSMRRWFLLDSLDNILREEIGISFDEVFDVIAEEPAPHRVADDKSIVRSAITGTLGIQSLTTLAESSYLFGAGHPIVDVERLFYYAQLVDGPLGTPVVGWPRKALPSIEGAILSIHHLYELVMWHKVSRFWVAAIKHLCFLLDLDPEREDRFEAQLGAILMAPNTGEALGVLEGQFRARHGVKESPLSGLSLSERRSFRAVYSTSLSGQDESKKRLGRLQALHSGEYRQLIDVLCKVISGLIREHVGIEDLVVDLPWKHVNLGRDVYLSDEESTFNLVELSTLGSALQLIRPLRIYVRANAAERLESRTTPDKISTSIEKALDRWANTLVY